MRTGARIVISLVAGLALVSCSAIGLGKKHGRASARHGVFSHSKKVSGVGVNSYLWRASLETIEFMPLVSADPYGGVIITGWHSEDQAPNERFKATVYILDTRLRADAIKVSVFKQKLDKNGFWKDADVNPETEAQIENAILTRARELKISTLN